LSEVWEKDSGAKLSILRTAIDSGYQTQNVYQWARRFAESRVIVVKGQESLNAVFSMPKDIMKRAKKSRPLARVWNVGVSIR
jgi:phage terminase large subunit GpA-like protein